MRVAAHIEIWRYDHAGAEDLGYDMHESRTICASAGKDESVEGGLVVLFTGTKRGHNAYIPSERLPVAEAFLLALGRILAQLPIRSRSIQDHFCPSICRRIVISTGLNVGWG